MNQNERSAFPISFWIRKFITLPAYKLFWHLIMMNSSLEIVLFCQISVNDDDVANGQGVETIKILILSHIILVYPKISRISHIIPILHEISQLSSLSPVIPDILIVSTPWYDTSKSNYNWINSTNPFLFWQIKPDTQPNKSTQKMRSITTLNSKQSSSILPLFLFLYELLIE